MSSAALPLFLVFHAAPGHGDAAELGRHAAERLRAAGRHVELFPARQPDGLSAAIGRAVNAAREARGAVVAVGGNTTINAVLQAAWNAQQPMGVLPPDGAAHPCADQGGLDRALEALLNAQVRPVPLGLVADRVFLRHAHIGLQWPRHRPETAAPASCRWAALRSDLGVLLRGRSLMTLELHAQGELRVVRTRSLRVGVQALSLQAPARGALSDAHPARLLAFARVSSSAAVTAAQQLCAGLGWWGSDDEADCFPFDCLQLPALGRQTSLQAVIDDEVLRLPLPLAFQITPRPLPLLLPLAAAAA